MELTRLELGLAIRSIGSDYEAAMALSLAEVVMSSCSSRLNEAHHSDGEDRFDRYVPFSIAHVQCNDSVFLCLFSFAGWCSL